MLTWRKTAIISAVAVGLLVILAPIALHYYLRWQAAKYRAELIRKGELLTFDQIVPKPPHPDDNGAPGLFAAASQLSFPASKDRLFYPLGVMRLIAPGRALISWQQP